MRESRRSSRRVSLRLLRDSDADYALLLRWLTDLRVLEWYEGRDEAYTIDRVRAEWAPEVQRAEHTTPYIAELDGQPIGYVQLVDVQPYAHEYAVDGDASGACAFDLFIGEVELWGRGLGTDVSCVAVETLLARGAARIFIDPRVVNERAVHVYEKIGFRQVKVLLGNEFHGGQAWDCWLMELDFAAFEVYENTGSSS